MTPRVSTTWLTTSSDNDFEATTHSIITALTGSTVFINPKPTLAETTTHLTAYTTAASAARDGGKLETATKNTARLVVQEDFRQIGQYIDETALTLEDFLSSKYPLQKERAPVGIQPAPANLRLKHGKVSGSLDATCDVNDHRVMYEWQTSIGQTPAEWTTQPSTNSSRTSFSGFTPGTWVNVRVRIRVPAGAGDWSSVVQIMMI
ncbi:MAG: hypothetical protein ABIT37_24445 [Luteolibacter sp.]